MISSFLWGLFDTVLRTIIARLAVALLRHHIPAVCRWLIQASAQLMPAKERDASASEWLADIDAIKNAELKLACALSVLFRFGLPSLLAARLRRLFRVFSKDRSFMAQLLVDLLEMQRPLSASERRQVIAFMHWTYDAADTDATNKSEWKKLERREKNLGDLTKIKEMVKEASRRLKNDSTATNPLEATKSSPPQKRPYP